MKRELKFHVVSEMKVTIDEAGTVQEGELRNVRVATKPDDGVSDDNLALIMKHAKELTELTGVLMVERVHRERNPIITTVRKE